MTDEVARDENGRFVKGHKGLGGRQPLERELRYYYIIKQSVSFDDWKLIIERAVADAKRGDHVARKWLSDYLIGPPIERKEISGTDGMPLKVIVEYAGDSEIDTNE